ncbi:MAG: hypothetical protein JNJ89_12815 [Rubrivivax sp.]|nr:hypothetical protein [Rubrivivax sp.]
MRAAWRALVLAGAAWCAAAPAQTSGFALEGDKRITLHARDGSQVEIGRVHFQRGADGRSSFRVALDATRFTDHFLSMREFKCLQGQGEILCHVPYPHRSPAAVVPGDLAWLEHSLLFLFKLPGEFGAKLWNGIYFKLTLTSEGLVGVPQAVDLNVISAPPARTDVAPFKPALRDDLPPNARWFTRLTIH